MSQSGWMKARLLGAGVFILAATAAVGFACGGNDNDKPGAAATSRPATTSVATSGAANATPTQADEDLGTTPGWAAGSTGTVFYTKEYFCNSQPCIVGEKGMNPSGVTDPVPSVWVLVPLFADTQGLTFHCNTPGKCPTHPTELDVTRAGLGNVIPLPPHSHIIDPTEAGFSTAGDTPWKVVVVGVKTRVAWDMLEKGKSLETLRAVQADQANATPDVPTNLILFFGVR